MNIHPQIQIEEQTTPSGKTLVLTAGPVQFKARSKNTEPHAVSFFEFQGKPFDQRAIGDPILLVAESLLRQMGYTVTYVDFGDEDLVEYPLPESLAPLPMLDENMTLLLEVDRYDGPISGLVEQVSPQGGIYWFEWCSSSGGRNSGRVYSLRPIPVEQQAAIRALAKRYSELKSELTVLNNPHVWPISESQRNRMRTIDEIEAELDHLETSISEAPWRSRVITAWMPECMTELAGVEIAFTNSDDPNQLEIWHRSVAQALADADQSRLDSLFENPAYPLTELDLFRVSLPGPNGALLDVMCDYQGQPLSESFWMTAQHRVSNLTSFVPQP